MKLISRGNVHECKPPNGDFHPDDIVQCECKKYWIVTSKHTGGRGYPVIVWMRMGPLAKFWHFTVRKRPRSA